MDKCLISDSRLLTRNTAREPKEFWPRPAFGGGITSVQGERIHTRSQFLRNAQYNHMCVRFWTIIRRYMVNLCARQACSSHTFTWTSKGRSSSIATSWNPLEGLPVGSFCKGGHKKSNFAFFIEYPETDHSSTHKLCNWLASERYPRESKGKGCCDLNLGVQRGRRYRCST